jgi:Helix-turn-helix domain of resolvase
MYSADEVARVRLLLEEGHNHSEIARRTGISRTTIRDWAAGRTPHSNPIRSGRGLTCTVCRQEPFALPQAPYTYLLGLYLGDGCLLGHRRQVYRLRISCAARYPELIQRCEAAMGAVLPNKVGRAWKQGCCDVYSYSKHWPCLFPQHGPGEKHTRRIVLTDWQQALVDRDPRPLLAGLLHSDGCRVLNWVNGTPYPRYHFANVSDDIKAIFAAACDALGIAWRPHNRVSLSVARRESVALLDAFVPPKR